ncbi:hypothetical protein [uncultured Ruegeria sp.]|uniref:hypothetical protein n=1 Tax=uncultured Ruegeria sp. TaxID=259304 RepID=UPI002615A9B5|nr:hypothetical protein [uncultured Ruegeria sp.]
MLLDRITNSRVETLPANFCSIPEACFQPTTTTAKIARLLIGGQVTRSVQLLGSSDFAAVRLDCDELCGAMEIFTDDGIGPRELVRQLDLTFGELKTLRQLRLQPRFLSTRGHPHCSVTGWNVLGRSMDKHRTATSAAPHLDNHSALSSVFFALLSIRVRFCPDKISPLNGRNANNCSLSVG